MKTFFLLFALATAQYSIAQIKVNDTLTISSPIANVPLTADTLTAGVHPIPTKARARDIVLVGPTHDLSTIGIYFHHLAPRQEIVNALHADRLLIVRQGTLTVRADTVVKILGAGGIALVTDGTLLRLTQTSDSSASFYLFFFHGRSTADLARARQAGPPILLDWPELVMKKTDKGESRQIFSRPVAWLSKIDMHATTLNPGEISHPQHVHRNEEIILLRSGHVRMHIANGYKDAGPGDLVFLPSGVPHNLENGPDGPTEYFALQWTP